jgi:type IV secretion system protein VirB9
VLLAALTPVSPVAAQVLPEPGPANPRLQTVRWENGQTIQLTALPSTGLTLLFEQGELIQRVDADRARVEARISSERDGLLLIPRREGDIGAVDAVTDRRSYNFALRTGTDLMAAYLVRFVSGAPVTELRPAPPMPMPGGPPMQAPMPGTQSWSYRVRGDAAVTPQAVTDDGVRTTIEFREGVPLPAVFAIGPAGDEQLVNGYMREGRFVIDEVWQELVFRIDARKATAKRSARPEDARG